MQECLDTVSPVVQRDAARYSISDILLKCQFGILHESPSPASPLPEISEADHPNVKMDKTFEFLYEKLLFQ